MFANHTTCPIRDDKARRTCSQLGDAAESVNTVVVLMLRRRGGCLATGSSSYCCSVEGKNTKSPLPIGRRVKRKRKACPISGSSTTTGNVSIISLSFRVNSVWM